MKKKINANLHIFIICIWMHKLKRVLHVPKGAKSLIENRNIYAYIYRVTAFTFWSLAIITTTKATKKLPCLRLWIIYLVARVLVYGYCCAFVYCRRQQRIQNDAHTYTSFFFLNVLSHSYLTYLNRLSCRSATALLILIITIFFFVSFVFIFVFVSVGFFFKYYFDML